MRKRITAIFTVVAILLVVSFVSTYSSTVYADCPTADSSKGQVLSGVGETGGNCDDSGVSNTISSIVSILSLITGVIAIIMIIISGLRYITSGGDSGKVAAAKNSLIYALIGLAIAASAQFLVRFVLFQSDKAITVIHTISGIS